MEHALAALTGRLATEDDLPALRELMGLSIDQLQQGFLSPVEIEASRSIMGLDTQLVLDRTYFIVEIDGDMAGCGGWSRRATLYGGDHSGDVRNTALLDPMRDAARVRAMYTHPAFTRRGVGRLLLHLSEAAAAAEGFGRVELMATMAGEPLYRACGYQEIERTMAGPAGRAIVPLIRMGKTIGPSVV